MPRATFHGPGVTGQRSGSRVLCLMVPSRQGSRVSLSLGSLSAQSQRDHIATDTHCAVKPGRCVCGFCGERNADDSARADRNVLSGGQRHAKGRKRGSRISRQSSVR